MRDTPVVVSQVAELRRAFDLSFALPPAQALAELEDLLAIRVAGDRYAIRLRDVTGLVAGRTIVPVPADAPDLLGLAGLRGGVVPVFGLASILGYGQAPAEPRWLILCGAEEPLALACSDFEGCLRVPKASLHACEDLRPTRQYVEQVASTEAGARAVIAMSLVVATIRKQSGPHRPEKE